MNRDIKKKQRKRLDAALTYLKKKNITQREIADLFDKDESYISELKSGKRTTIPDDFLKMLQENYHINPDYIRGDSEFMIDITGTKLEHFEKFTDSWDIVQKGEHKYIHFTIDKNFYDFLVEYDNARAVTESGISSLEEELQRLKELYVAEPNPQEYVLIPRNNFIEILNDSGKEHRQLAELLDLHEYEDYIDE